MDQVYRIEIPIEVINETDASSLGSLETALQRVFSTATKSKDSAQSAANAVTSGAQTATNSLQKVGTAAEEAGASITELDLKEAGFIKDSNGKWHDAEGHFISYENAIKKVAAAQKEAGAAGKKAGEDAASGMEQAEKSSDSFLQRTQKSLQSLRKMFAQKLQLTLAAIDKVSPILKSVGSSLKNMTSKAWHIAVRMTDLVTAPFRKLVQMITSPIAMTLSLVGVGLGASSFLNTFTDFSAGMSNVKALSRATDEEFIRLTETAENLGATTKYTAAEASQGMQYLAMAGWDTTQIIEAMPGLLDLAAAGATDLGTAADIVSDVMTAMGMAANEASTAADIFARTATSTNTTIETLGESLKYAAPIAHSFGLTLSEVSTLTGMMGNAGIKASQAGTALRSSFLRMASPTSEMVDTMKKLNLSFADETGKMKTMAAIVGDLSVAFSGLSEQEKLSYAQDIFGSEASSAWLGIISQGADEYERLFKAIDGSAGAAKEMANTQLDNLAGDMVLLQSAVDGMKITLMKELNPYLRQAVQWATSKIPMLTEKVGEFVAKGISKAKELKNFLQDVFTSADFQSADGFIDKFFVAWDKIIAEPFQKWWDGGGQDTILGAVSKIGKNLGDLWHGIVSGILAALKGEDIDFEGMNLTGIAKAGAEAAKTFIASFKDAFDLRGLFDEAPGLLKAGLFGFGAFKVGGGAISLVKTISQIRIAFLGIPAAAGTATAATNAFGASAAAGVAGTSKLAAGLGVVKTALAAIPVWGWVAAAALTAVIAGVALYNKAQEDERNSILHMGDSVVAAVDKCKESAAQVNEAMDVIGQIKEIELKVTENKGGNAQVIKEFQDELSKIEYDAIVLYAKMADKAISDEDKTKLQEELNRLESEKQALIHTKLAEISRLDRALLNLQIATLALNDAQIYSSLNEPTDTDITAMNGKIAEIQLQKAQVYAQLSDTVDPEEVAALNETITKLTLAELTLKAKLGTMSAENTETANSYIGSLGTTLDTIKLKAAMGTLTEEDIAAANEMIGGLEFQKATIQTILDAGNGTLTNEEEASLKTLIDAVETHKAEIEAKLKNDGTLTDTEKTALQGEIDNLNEKKVLIESLLANGGSLDATTKGELVAELAELNKEQISISAAVGGTVDDTVLKDWLAQNNEKEVTLKATLDASGYDYLQVALISSQVNSIDEAEKEFALILTDNSTLTPDQIAGYTEKLSALATKQYTYELLIQGAEMNETEVQNAKDLLAKIDGQVATATLALNDTSLTPKQRQALLNQITKLKNEAADIQLVLKGAESAGNTKEINAMKAELGKIRGEEAAIYLSLGLDPNSKIKQADLDTMIGMMNGVGTMNARLNITLADGSLRPEDLETAASALETLYEKLAEMSGGAFTKEDLESEAATVEQVQQHIQARKDVDLLNLDTEIVKQKRDLEKAVEARYTYATQAETAGANASVARSAYTELIAMQDEVDKLNAKRENLLERFRSTKNGTPESDAAFEAYLTYENGAYTEGIDAQIARYNELRQGWYGNEGWDLPGNMGQFSVSDRDIIAGMEAFGYAAEEMKEYAEKQSGIQEKNQAGYNQQNGTLIDLYQSEKYLMEGNTFNGTSVAGYSLEELAEQYHKIDEAGQDAFANAIAGLAELNNAATYLSDSDKVDIGSILGTAEMDVTADANLQVLGNVNKVFSELSERYQGLQQTMASTNDEDYIANLQAEMDSLNADSLEAVNAALEALGLDKIDSIGDLSAKLQEIEAIDPSGLDFTAAAASLEALGGNADAVRQKVEATKAQLEGLAKTYTVTINYVTTGSVPAAPEANAMGGIYDGAFLSWVAEDGPEAIIPLGNDKRGRGLDLWMQAGRMLGVTEFADGGIMAPYTGILADIPDDLWDDNGEPKKPQPVPAGGQTNRTVNVTVTANPEYTIEGAGSPQDVMAEIADHQYELAEMLGEAMADQLVDILSNVL